MIEYSPYDIDIKVLQNGKSWEKFELLKSVTIELHDDSVIGPEITIPAGFRFDGRSSPGWLKHIMPTFGKRAIAYLLHDWLYKNDVGVKQMGKVRARRWQDSEMLNVGRMVFPAAWYSLLEMESKLSYYLVRILGNRKFRKLIK
jgi:hypothetical protein